MSSNQGVQVIRRRNNLYPCIRCRFKNNWRIPKSTIHMAQLRSKFSCQSLSWSYGMEDYAERLGFCPDYKEISVSPGD